MREVWDIPVWEEGGHEDWFEQWILHMMMGTCDRVLMIAWTILFACNEVTHEKDLPSIEGSRRFICSYMHSLQNIKHATIERIIKGKHIASPEPVRSPVQSAPHAIWVRPGEGELKLNIDRAFAAHTMEAGMILRCSDGSIVFSACRVLCNCMSALQAELSACLEGVCFASDMGLECITVETDCQELVCLAHGKEPDGSLLFHLVEDLRLCWVLIAFLMFTKFQDFVIVPVMI
jgi:hypothetical protein